MFWLGVYIFIRGVSLENLHLWFVTDPLLQRHIIREGSCFLQPRWLEVLGAEELVVQRFLEKLMREKGLLGKNAWLASKIVVILTFSG